MKITPSLCRKEVIFHPKFPVYNTIALFNRDSHLSIFSSERTFCRKRFVVWRSMGNRETSQHWFYTVPTTIEPLILARISCESWSCEIFTKIHLSFIKRIASYSRIHSNYVIPFNYSFITC